MAQRELVTAHNISDIMGKSKKRTPAGTWCNCKSQKHGKQISHRKFRRVEHVLVNSRFYERLPFRHWEIVSQWDLGGDGKCFMGYHPDEDWFIKLMRK